MSQLTIAAPNTALPAQVAAAAAAAGLTVLSAEPATAISGAPTTRFVLALAANPARTLQLELSQSFDFADGLAAWLAEAAVRMRNPRPDAYLTLNGLPLTFSQFAWPFHDSSAGADTSLVHGQVNLADGGDGILHAKISASMTVTFRAVVKAPEQPFAEGFIYNAVRKTMDQGQLELVKSGNRQPVPVTTRYYSVKTGKFSFNDTTEQERTRFLAAKTFWLSGVLGAGEPVWLLDPRDAQYLNTTLDELKKNAEALAGKGLIELGADGFAMPTASLMARDAEYRAEVAAALAAIKPSFNEEMRGGHTNM
ncbi:hypothetical protein SAMN05421770_101368 [Granulicella rosea]|uniref:Uncharacterized protein n=1 Tax=Granulicella rosea TaxID=474952 RepID=A0A239DC14_9BACT|nr:hypothetical protein [Granulicella rosea]SNS29233.1 hypothetical protein SAMN05421770_101368 [Granulicella rosea]